MSSKHIKPEYVTNEEMNRLVTNRIQTLEACVRSLLSIVENSNCCDSPLYRDDIEAIKARFNGIK